MRLIPLLFLAQSLGMSVGAIAQTCPAPSHPAETMIPFPRPDAGGAREEKILHALNENSYQAIVLGDSLMQGWDQAMLDDAMGATTLNYGVGQDTTQSVLWRLKATDWSKQSPQRVLLLVGTNDIGHSVCDIYWGMLTVVKAVHTTFPQARIIVTSILPRGPDLMQRDPEIRAVNLMLKKSTIPGNYSFFDAHNAFLCGHKTPCALFQENNLHLTRDGYTLLTELLKKHLSEDQERR